MCRYRFYRAEKNISTSTGAGVGNDCKNWSAIQTVATSRRNKGVSQIGNSGKKKQASSAEAVGEFLFGKDAKIAETSNVNWSERLLDLVPQLRIHRS